MITRTSEPAARRKTAKTRRWRCLRCGRSFARRNEAHFCGSPRELAAHFDGKPPGIRLLFGHLLEEILACGPLTVLFEKTRIAFQAGMAFMAVTVKPTALHGHLVLAERSEHPWFSRVDHLAPGRHVHHFRLTTSDEIDPQFVGWIRTAYAAGQHRRR